MIERLQISNIRQWSIDETIHVNIEADVKIGR